MKNSRLKLYEVGNPRVEIASGAKGRGASGVVRCSVGVYDPALSNSCHNALVLQALPVDPWRECLLAKKKKPFPPSSTRRRKKDRVKNESESQWAILKGNAIEGPGAPLLALLLQATTTRGLSIRELAEDHLGLTYSHFTLLRKGQRSISNIGDETMAKIAKFLGLPKVIVMIAAGRLKVEDFYSDPTLLDQQLGPALEFIQRDPELGLSLPPSAFIADLDLQRFIVLLYEKASGKTLLPNRANLTDILQILQTTPPRG